MKKLIIHIGYPKTATTTLQDLCFVKLAEEKKINYLGKYPESLSSNDVSRSLIRYLLYNKKDEFFDKEMNFLKSLDFTKTTILSNEDLSISFLKHCDGFYVKEVNTLEVAERIFKLFSEVFDEIVILISIRSQTTTLYSFYVEIYKWKYRHIKELDTYQKFLKDGFRYKKDGNFLMFYYNDIYKKYIEIFGKENVHIVLFEDIKHDIENYSKKLSKILNVNNITIKEIFSTKQTNVKYKDKYGNYIVDDIDLGLEINQFISKMLRYKPILYLKNKFYNEKLKRLYREKLLKKMKQIVVKKGKVIPKQTYTEKEMILTEFEQSNYNLFKVASIDFEKAKKYEYVRKNYE